MPAFNNPFEAQSPSSYYNPAMQPRHSLPTPPLSSSGRRIAAAPVQNPSPVSHASFTQTPYNAVPGPSSSAGSYAQPSAGIPRAQPTGSSHTHPRVTSSHHSAASRQSAPQKAMYPQQQATYTQQASYQHMSTGYPQQQSSRTAPSQYHPGPQSYPQQVQAVQAHAHSGQRSAGSWPYVPSQQPAVAAQNAAIHTRRPSSTSSASSASSLQVTQPSSHPHNVQAHPAPPPPPPPPSQSQPHTAHSTNHVPLPPLPSRVATQQQPTSITNANQPQPQPHHTQASSSQLPQSQPQQHPALEHSANLMSGFMKFMDAGIRHAHMAVAVELESLNRQFMAQKEQWLASDLKAHALEEEKKAWEKEKSQLLEKLSQERSARAEAEASLLLVRKTAAQLMVHIQSQERALQVREQTSSSEQINTEPQKTSTAQIGEFTVPQKLADVLTAAAEEKCAQENEAKFAQLRLSHQTQRAKQDREIATLRAALRQNQIASPTIASPVMQLDTGYEAFMSVRATSTPAAQAPPTPPAETVVPSTLAHNRTMAVHSPLSAPIRPPLPVTPLTFQPTSTATTSSVPDAPAQSDLPAESAPTTSVTASSVPVAPAQSDVPAGSAPTTSAQGDSPAESAPTTPMQSNPPANDSAVIVKEENVDSCALSWLMESKEIIDLTHDSDSPVLRPVELDTNALEAEINQLDQVLSQSLSSKHGPTYELSERKRRSDEDEEGQDTNLKQSSNKRPRVSSTEDVVMEDAAPSRMDGQSDSIGSGGDGAQLTHDPTSSSSAAHPTEPTPDIVMSPPSNPTSSEILNVTSVPDVGQQPSAPPPSAPVVSTNPPMPVTVTAPIVPKSTPTTGALTAPHVPVKAEDMEYTPSYPSTSASGPSSRSRPSLSIRHLDLAYQKNKNGTKFTCRMCIHRKTNTMDPVVLKTFPASANMAELSAHCEEEHPSGFKALIDMAPVTIASMRAQLSASGY